MLATLSTCALPKPIQFCDPDDYDIIPIRMVQPVTGRQLLDEKFYETDQPSVLHIEEVSITEVSLDSSNDADHEGRFDTLTDPNFDADDWEVSEEDLEKVRLLLKEREVPLEIPPSKPRGRFCKSHRKFQKQA